MRGESVFILCIDRCTFVFCIVLYNTLPPEARIFCHILVAFQGKFSIFIEKIPKYPSASVSGKIFLGSLDEKDFSTTFRLSNATIRFSDTYFIGSYVCLEKKIRNEEWRPTTPRRGPREHCRGGPGGGGDAGWLPAGSTLSGCALPSSSPIRRLLPSFFADVRHFWRRNAYIHTILQPGI